MKRILIVEKDRYLGPALARLIEFRFGVSTLQTTSIRTLYSTSLHNKIDLVILGAVQSLRVGAESCAQKDIPYIFFSSESPPALEGAIVVPRPEFETLLIEIKKVLECETTR